LDTLTETTDGNIPTIKGYISYPNGWYRLYMVINTSSQTNANVGIRFGTSSVDNVATFYLWGAQIEIGSFPTSFIPTTTGSVTRRADVANVVNSNIYNIDNFTIINKPFGSSGGSNTLSLVGPRIERTSVYSQYLSQAQINSVSGRTDDFWRWRIIGSSFGLPNFTTDGQVTVDWGDGTVETLTTSDHTFSNGGGYHEIGFRLDSGTYFSPSIADNNTHETKVIALGPAPESMKLDGNQTFRGCSNLEVFDATVDTSLENNFYYTWYNCSSLKSFPLIDTSSGTSFFSAWGGLSSLTSFPLIDTSSGVNFSFAWRVCTSLTSFPAIDTSSGTNFSNAWYNCSSLTNFPEIDTSNGTIFYGAWYNCSSLTNFPEIDTSNGTNFVLTWYNCNALNSFPLIDTSNGTNFNTAWRFCSSLTTFPPNFFDSWSGTPENECFVNTWKSCSALTSTSVENILNSIDTSGQSAPASGVDITIDYNASSGTPDITVPAINLISKGWTTTLNGSLKDDPTQFASLDLDFATNKSLIDNVSSNNLITFTRSSTATYVDSNGIIQTAAIDTPRFDHDPETGESLGLLMEYTGTNYNNNSLPSSFNDFQRCTKTTGIIAPDGTSTAINYVNNGVSADYIFKSFTLPVVAQTYYTISIFSTHDNMDITQGGIASGSYSIVTPTYHIPYGNGWYRHWRVYQTIPDNATTTPQIVIDTIGPSSNQSLWGLQVEVGLHPSSYIPTNGSTDTRNRDNASITGANFGNWFNQNEGTFYAYANRYNSGVSSMRIVSNQNATAAYIVIDPTNNILCFDGDNISASSSSLPPTFVKAVSVYTPTQKKVGANGNITPFGNRNSTFPLTPATELKFGARAGNNYYYGHISQLSYWPRILKDTSLQYITQ